MKHKNPVPSLLLLYLCAALSLFISITGLGTFRSIAQFIWQLAFLPVTLSLLYTAISQLVFHIRPSGLRLLVYYDFIITAALIAGGWLAANTTAQLISAAIFSPLALYFFLQVLPRRHHAIRLPQIFDQPATGRLVEEGESLSTKAFDFDRRAFLKLIGSAGISVFVFSLFTKRAEAAFFGHAPSPGTVSLTDTSNNKIDPAEKNPTDGYSITELDDSTPAYYGFVNKLGQWFIMREDSTSTPHYGYIKGDSDFSTNWTGRVSMSYDYFDNVF